jgi:hypothetical protein
VTSIAEQAFVNCAALSISVDLQNENYLSIDGSLYSEDGKSLLQYAIGKNDTTFTVPDFVSVIGDGAFEYCRTLINITLPDSLTSIGAHAFDSCFSLTDIYYSGSEEDFNRIGGLKSIESLEEINLHFGKN